MIGHQTHLTATELTNPGRLSRSGNVKGTTQVYSYSDCRTSDSGFSRHDSLFSFGASSSRNAAELKSLLGNSSARLRPGGHRWAPAGVARTAQRGAGGGIAPGASPTTALHRIRRAKRRSHCPNARGRMGRQSIGRSVDRHWAKAYLD